MSARKLQQEIEKCFKQVDIGVEAFDSQYEKYDQSTNASQRDKLVDNIKKECKKLQRLRDQIKTWAAGNEVKDKGPLLDKRELIESKMEAFKAVEKEQKTKAFSKEGLSASARLDPREKDKAEMTEFLQDMVDNLSRQIEALEAETETLQLQVKKSKKDNAKADRLGEMEHRMDRHKWHQEQLELLMRALANDDVETDQVKGSEEDIRNYVENNQEVDFYEDEGIYDDFGLDEEAENFGAAKEDREESPLEPEPPVDVQPPEAPTVEVPKAKKALPEVPTQSLQARRPSQPTNQLKSPLPNLATIQSAPPVSTTIPAPAMKPAPPPTKPPGETLKYASAAAAAAANDAAGIGIAPLPPPPVKTPAPTAVTASPALAHVVAEQVSVKSSAASSPVVTPAQPSRAATAPSPVPVEKSAAPSAPRSPVQSSVSGPSPVQSVAHSTQASTADESISAPSSSIAAPTRFDSLPRDHDSGFGSDDVIIPKKQQNGIDHRDQEDESIYHLPAALRELLEAYESIKLSSTTSTPSSHNPAFTTSYTQRPDTYDLEKPRHYKPANPSIFTPKHYPQEPLPIFDDPRLYAKIDTDALFYSFYYRQGTYQQYMAAKALKGQSWRFHTQYQTWFQRHEEPKNITEDYEQGTYRFFDYESTW